jgi:small-conductance mechanosensitive channel
MDMFSWHTLSTYFFITLRIIVIAGLGMLAARSVKRYKAREIQKLPQEALRLGVIARIIIYTIYALAGLMIIKELGIQTTPFMGIVGIIGIAFGLAMQASLANILSGIFLMVEHPYEVGDTITVENTPTGTVIESTLYATILKTADNKIIRIPHAKLIKSSLVIESQNKK